MVKPILNGREKILDLLHAVAQVAYTEKLTNILSGILRSEVGMHQLDLHLAIPKATNDKKTAEQRLTLERLCETLSQEAAEILAIANQLHGKSWQKLAMVPTDALRPATAEYRRRHGIVVPKPRLGPIKRKPLRSCTFQHYMHGFPTLAHQ